MKKGLLAGTALVAIATMLPGPANAQVELGLSGYMYQWFGYAKNDDDLGVEGQEPVRNDFSGTNTASDTEIHFVGETTLDNGLMFGVNVQLEGNTESDQIDESYLYVEGTFGRVELGSENSASFKMQYAAPDVGIELNSGDQDLWISFDGVGGDAGYDRSGFNSTFVEVDRNNDARRLTYYSPRFFGFQVGASYAPNTNQDDNGPVDRDADEVTDIFNIGANYVETFGGFEVAVAGGWGRGKGNGGIDDDPTAWSLGTNIGFAGFTVGGSYAQTKDNTGDEGDTTGWDIGVSYETGPWAVSLAFLRGKRDGQGTGPNGDGLDANGNVLAQKAELNTLHLSSSYALGPGVKMAGTIGGGSLKDEGGAGKDNDYWYAVVGPRLKF